MSAKLPTIERLKDHIGEDVYFMCNNRIQQGVITEVFTTVYNTLGCHITYERKSSIRGGRVFTRKIISKTIFTDRVLLAESPEQLVLSLIAHLCEGNKQLTIN